MSPSSNGAQSFPGGPASDASGAPLTGGAADGQVYQGILSACRHGIGLLAAQPMPQNIVGLFSAPLGAKVGHHAVFEQGLLKFFIGHLCEHGVVIQPLNRCG